MRSSLRRRSSISNMYVSVFNNLLCVSLKTRHLVTSLFVHISFWFDSSSTLRTLPPLFLNNSFNFFPSILFNGLGLTMDCRSHHPRIEGGGLVTARLTVEMETDLDQLLVDHTRDKWSHGEVRKQILRAGQYWHTLHPPLVHPLRLLLNCVKLQTCLHMHVPLLLESHNTELLSTVHMVDI